MQTISYRGITFDWVQTLEQKWTPVMTEDGQDYICSKLDLIVLVTLNPQVNSIQVKATGGITRNTGQLGAITERSVRHTLAQARGILVVQTYDGSILISSPPAGLQCDVRGGPYCEVLGSPIFHSDRTWEWKLHFTTYINECPTPRIFLAHRFEQHADVDEIGYTKIVTYGKAIVNLGQLLNSPFESADSLRTALVFPIPLGFSRKVQVTLSSSGTELEYTTTDEQKAIGYSATVAQKIEAVQSATWINPSLTGMLVSPVNIAVNVAGGAISGALTGRPTGPIAGAISGGVSQMSIEGSRVLATWINTITVNCWGTALATRARLTALAFAIARARIGPTSGKRTTSIGLFEELTGKFSQVIMTHTSGFVDGGIFTGSPGTIALATPELEAVITTPPPPAALGFPVRQQDSIRRLGNSFLSETINTAIPVGAALGGPLPTNLGPTNPTTPAIPGVPLPPPPGDGLSFGTYFVDLVYQALTNPCAAPEETNTRPLP